MNAGVDVIMIEVSVQPSRQYGTAIGYRPPLHRAMFEWGQGGGCELGSVAIQPGARAVVLCADETCFRALRVEGTAVGEAVGHAGLAAKPRCSSRVSAGVRHQRETGFLEQYVWDLSPQG